MAQCVTRARTVDREPDIAQSYVFADYAEAGRLYSRTARRGGGAEVGGRRHPLRFSRTPAYAAFLKGDVGMLLAHPMLLHAADRARVPYAHAAFPMKDGGAAPPVGLSD
ncbi:hypothetical protein [Streptomyces noursei]|uniref:hypothetical protein n=1 Tax=Streptomyces noursei TaxID=1971 RepID=UPI000C9C4175|nr:hypothetical protein [Streptomyces noursei]